jgi:hypothetical protein
LLGLKNIKIAKLKKTSLLIAHITLSHSVMVEKIDLFYFEGKDVRLLRKSYEEKIIYHIS